MSREVDLSMMVRRGLWAMSNEREVRITRIDGTHVTGKIRLFLADVPAPSSGKPGHHSTVRFAMVSGETVRINDVKEMTPT